MMRPSTFFFLIRRGIRNLGKHWACLLYTSRHTTFGTILDDVQIDDAVVQAAFDRYMAMRADLGRENKPRCMMDLATIGAKELKNCLLYTSRCV